MSPRNVDSPGFHADRQAEAARRAGGIDEEVGTSTEGRHRAVNKIALRITCIETSSFFHHTRLGSIA